MKDYDESHYSKVLKEKFSNYCLWGSCPQCSRIVDGRGIHDVEIYEILRFEKLENCYVCSGKGYTEEECPHCEGFGIIDEPCFDCSGKGKVPDESGKTTHIRNEAKILKNRGLDGKKKIE